MKKRLFKKKFLIFTILTLTLIVSASLILVSCGKKKKDNLNDISKNLSNYYIDIQYDDAKKSATATVEIDYINPSDALFKEIKLHLYIASFTASAKHKPVSNESFNRAYYNGVSYAGLNIERAFVGEHEVVPKYEGEDNDIMVLPLLASLYPNERINIKIEYNFTLPNMNHRFGYGENTINFGNFYPIVCHYDGGFKTDGYSENGDPFCSDMANYYVNIIANKNLVLASSGNVKNSTTDKDLAFYDIEALCCRDFAFILGKNFKVKTCETNGCEIKYYYIFDKNPDKSLKASKDAIDTFSKLFYPYPYETYSVVEGDFCYGGMEFPTLSLISNDIENQDDYMNVIIHETAHQWWFGLVGNDEYNEAWLDESLTEFSTLIFYDHNSGYNFNREDMVDAVHTSYIKFIDVYEDILGRVDTTMARPLNEFDTEPEYTYTIYVKGVLMFDSLYKLIGEKKFIEGLNLYAERYAYKVACGDDLIACFEDAKGTNLENFFDCWLNGRVIIG